MAEISACNERTNPKEESKDSTASEMMRRVERMMRALGRSSENREEEEVEVVEENGYEIRAVNNIGQSQGVGIRKG